ncbi:hypothetical protein ACT1U9_32290 [Streptomyces sp. BR1]
MIAELQRTFCEAQFGSDFPLFVDYGVPLWVPGAGGAIGPDHAARMT